MRFMGILWRFRRGNGRGFSTGPSGRAPIFVRDVLGDGSKDFVNRLRGRGRAQYHYRIGIVLDDNFIASAHAIQQ
jgi:hypothetical protein